MLNAQTLPDRSTDRSTWPKSRVLAMRNLGAVWASLFPEEQRRIVNLMIRRVQIT